MEQLELELLAEDIRERAGLVVDDFVDVIDVTHALLGDRSLLLDPDLAGLAYLRRRGDGRYEIVVKPGKPDFRHRVAHEIGHYALREIAQVRMTPAEEEIAANYVAGAILAPRAMIQKAFDFYGPELDKLDRVADAFGISQTSAQIRIADVVGEERAIVTAKHANVIVRNARTIDWTDPEIRSSPLRARAPGLAKPIVLRGGIDEGRIALRVRPG